MRAFVALPVPEALHPPLEVVQAALGVGRLMPPENWHVTLAFLDDQPTERLEEMHGALEQITQPGLDLEIRGLGVFGSRKPRLLYAAVTPSEALTTLRRTPPTPGWFRGEGFAYHA